MLTLNLNLDQIAELSADAKRVGSSSLEAHVMYMLSKTNWDEKINDLTKMIRRISKVSFSSYNALYDPGTVTFENLYKLVSYNFPSMKEWSELLAEDRKYFEADFVNRLIMLPHDSNFSIDKVEHGNITYLFKEGNK